MHFNWQVALTVHAAETAYMYQLNLLNFFLFLFVYSVFIFSFNPQQNNMFELVVIYKIKFRQVTGKKTVMKHNYILRIFT